MSDVARGAPEGETPVNPYSLLEAVNRASETAHTAWLIFLAIMAYVAIAAAGVTHKDLLLQTPVALPLLQVDIQLAAFFRFAPILVVVFHLGLVSQLALLAREARELDAAIRLIESTDERAHPLRLELANFFFVQSIAGPDRSRVMTLFLNGISWLTLVGLPILLLLYLQAVFLPYHDGAITWTQRIALLADIVMLSSLGLFLMGSASSFVTAVRHTTRAHLAGFIATFLFLAGVAVVAFFAVTIPGERLDKLAQAALGIDRDEDAGRPARAVAGYAAWLFAPGSDAALFGLVHRNLSVTDQDFVSDRDATPGEPSLSLRDRDLRFARLDRSDLHQADLTGADLRGASLTGADLRGAWLTCADLTQLAASGTRDRANCTRAQRANFSRARLDGAHLAGADLSGAKLEEAKLEAAELSSAILDGANFTSAKLDKADVTGRAAAVGATFVLASLQGADFAGAHLDGADLSSTSAEGASFDYARLVGAKIRDASFEAATFYQATLIGADLTGLRLTGADLRGARVWMAVAPPSDNQGIADLSDLSLTPISDADQNAIRESLASIASPGLKGRLAEAMGAYLDPTEAAKWDGSAGQSAWRDLVAQSGQLQADLYRGRLTDYLMKLQCRGRWSSGAVATGIARRARTRQFRGDPVQIYDRLTREDCPAAKTVLPKALRDLAAAADLARGN